MPKTQLIKGIACIFGSIILMTVTPPQIAGIVISVGVLEPYLISFFAQRDPKVDISILFYISSLANIIESLGLCKSHLGFGANLKTILSSRLLALFGCLMLSASLFFPLFVETPGFFILIFGGLLGLGAGPCMNSAIWSSSKHFPNFTGFVIGLNFFGYGLAPFFWNWVFAFLVNPDFIDPYIPFVQNENKFEVYPEKVAKKVEEGLMFLALIVLVAGILGMILISDVKREIEIEEKKELSIKRAFLSREYIVMVICGTCGFTIVLVVNNFFKTYGEMGITDEITLETVISVVLISQCLARLIWPTISDYIGYKKLMWFIFSVFFVCVSLLNWANEHPVSYGLAVGAILVCGGGINPVEASSMMKVFGDLAPKLFAYSSIAVIIASVFLLLLVYVMKNFRFLLVWIILDVLIILAIFCLFFYKKSYCEKLIPLLHSE